MASNVNSGGKQIWAESWFQHLLVVILDKLSNLLATYISGLKNLANNYTTLWGCYKA